MSLPRLIITGSSGFIGRHVLDSLKEDFEIIGMARRSQLRCGAVVHPNITWIQVDIGDPEPLRLAFDQVKESGGADYVIHLAAHYDFTGDDHPEYWRTNVDGMRNVLEQCRDLDLKCFIFASSVAACNFPKKGEVLTEKSPPDGDHIYAKTKKIGEEMLAEYDATIPSRIVRFAALFSDMCEYPPLYFFLETWLNRVWNARIIGGRGLSAIPYLHVREVGRFMRQLIARCDDLSQREIVIASPSSTLNHIDLFDLANVNFRGRRLKPLMMPKFIARIGVWGRDILGRILGDRPFERPWMMKYVDLDLRVDASHTYQRIGWRPRSRLLLERRMAFLVEHRKSDPKEWHRLNRAALKEVRVRPNLRIQRLIEKHLDTICTRFLDSMQGEGSVEVFPSYQKVPRDILEWRFMVLLRHLQSSVRTLDRGLFTAYCRDLAEKRIMQGFGVQEVCRALITINETCINVLSNDPEAVGLETELRDYLSMTIQFGCDQVMEIYEELGGEELSEEE